MKMAACCARATDRMFSMSDTPRIEFLATASHSLDVTAAAAQMGDPASLVALEDSVRRSRFKLPCCREIGPLRGFSGAWRKAFGSAAVAIR